MRVLKIAMIIPLLFIFLNNKAQAQGKYGATPQDSVECLLNLNFYQEEYKRDNLKAAYAPWKEVLRLCPQFGMNTFLRAPNIMREHIKGITDPAEKKAAIEFFLKTFDDRLKYFPDNKSNKPAELAYRKADVIEEYYPEDHQMLYDTYLSVIENNKDEAEVMAAAKAMVNAQKLYEAKKIDDNQFTDIYSNLSSLVDQRISKINSAGSVDTIALDDARTCKAAIENAFISTEAANCDNLIKLFTPRFQANKNDIATVGMIVSILLNRECVENDLFYQAAEAYYKLDPSAKSAATLAAMFRVKGEIDKSIEYYKNAIAGQTVAAEKSGYQTTLAALLLQQGQTGQASTYANQAISSNPRNGQAYFILASIYAGTKGCGSDSDPVSRRSVFWVAVDILNQAKSVEKEAKFVDAVNKQINLYRQHFPSYDDCFDQDILDGQSYTVNCGGINRKTIVRTRK